MKGFIRIIELEYEDIEIRRTFKPNEFKKELVKETPWILPIEGMMVSNNDEQYTVIEYKGDDDVYIITKESIDDIERMIEKASQ